MRNDRHMSIKMAKTLMRMFPIETDPAARYSGAESVQIERARTEYADETASGFLGHFDNGTKRIAGNTILDLGSGYGGRPVRYAELGAESVVGIEIADAVNKIASAFASEKRADNVRFVTAVGEKLPFESNTFDIITSYDVLEHVQYPADTLQECFRVLKNGGRMFVVFPPYYSMYGSHIYGYISLLPFANILFSPATLMIAIDELLLEMGSSFRPMPLRPGDKLYALNGLTVSGFIRAALRSGFSIRSLSYKPIAMPKLTREVLTNIRVFSIKTGGTVLSLLSHLFCRVPGMREMLTDKVVCELQKTINE